MILRTFILNVALAASSLPAAEPTNSLPAVTTNWPTTFSTNAVSRESTNVVPIDRITIGGINMAPAATTNLSLTSTNASDIPAAAASDDSTKDVVSFSNFKIITQRNIFDPNRRAPRPPGSREDYRRPNRVDYLNLVGAMSYEKGRFAFFDGSSSEYRKSVKPGDSIAGYKVASVANDKVTLQKDDKKIELPVGGQLKREDEGEWRVNANAENFASPTNSSEPTSSASVSPSAAGSSGPKSDSSFDETNPILKRLMEARKQGK